MTTNVSSSKLLEVENLRILFGLLKAVDRVSFDIRPEEIFGIIGESGSGKSTLGRAMVCLQKPTSGTVRHQGRDPFALPARKLREHRRDYQIIFQDPNASLNPRLPIGHSVREPLDIARWENRALREERVAEMLERVGLNRNLAHRFPHELSGGEKQRANIARALVLRPKVIICDEVVAALDVSLQADVLNLFMELRQEFGLTYAFISHDLGVVSHISDRIAVLYLGKIMELGPAEGLMERPLHPYTQALLSAEPVPLPSAMRSSKRIVLKGEIPSPVSPPSGCRFRTRCPIATERCAAAEPAWRQVSPGRWVACHYVDAPAPSSGAQAHEHQT